MDASNAATTITRERTILRFMDTIAQDKLPLYISSVGAEAGHIFSSKIARIDRKNNQLVLHQLTQGKRSDALEPGNEIEVTCYMQHGKLKFDGQLSPLEDSSDSLYCSMPIPHSLSKKQLRASFRVSLLRYSTESQLEIAGNVKAQGTCMDISLSGALVQVTDNPQQAITIEEEHQCRIIIPGQLDLSCGARVCHVSKTDGKQLLVGLNFVQLDPSQLRTIKSALAKLQRQSIARTAT